MKKTIRFFKWHFFSIALLIALGIWLSVDIRSFGGFALAAVPAGLLFVFECFLHLYIGNPNEPHYKYISGIGWCIVKGKKILKRPMPDEPAPSAMFSCYGIKDKAYYKYELWKAQKKLKTH